MFYLKFFLGIKPSEEEIFQSKLSEAINLIRENRSIVAMKVIEVIDAGYLSIHSFFKLSYDHYLDMVEDMKESQVDLSGDFPPSIAAVRQIEKCLEGIIFNNETIYINSQKSADEIANILIHEVCHFINSDIFKNERLAHNFKRASYNDEIRSFIAEKTFERNGYCLRRSDIKKIHAIVTKLYPSFAVSQEEESTSGYLFSRYDTPS